MADVMMGMGMGMEELEALGMSGGSPAGSSATMSVAAAGSEDEAGDLRRGPWTVDEDVLLVNYIAAHGEGRWNSLARSAGLRRTGKSCRLRWLNYLRPDVRRGNMTAEEQLVILELHSRWGNRWSKIAQHLPGRTDNEIKNYWRTRVQKHAKHLRCDVNSARFRHLLRHIWMPRLAERLHAAAAAPPPATTTASAPAACYHLGASSYQHQMVSAAAAAPPSDAAAAAASPDTSSALRSTLSSTAATTEASRHGGACGHAASAPAASEGGAAVAQPAGHGGMVTTGPATMMGGGGDVFDDGDDDVFSGSWSELLATAGRDDAAAIGLPDFDFGDLEDNYLWSLDDLCLQQKC
ncbi:hypothetical protein ACP4OV_016507 [Aristida adscensionis]